MKSRHAPTAIRRGPEHVRRGNAADCGRALGAKSVAVIHRFKSKALVSRSQGLFDLGNGVPALATSVKAPGSYRVIPDSCRIQRLALTLPNGRVPPPMMRERTACVGIDLGERRSLNLGSWHVTCRFHSAIAALLRRPAGTLWPGSAATSGSNTSFTAICASRSAVQIAHASGRAFRSRRRVRQSGSRPTSTQSFRISAPIASQSSSRRVCWHQTGSAGACCRRPRGKRCPHRGRIPWTSRRSA